MDIVLGILQSLGANETVWLQLVLFLVAYIFLSKVLFKPYLEAYIERKKRTEGNQQIAERVIAETQELEHVYQKKARSLNTEHKQIYDQSRSQAIHEHSELVNKAKANAKTILEETKANIAEEIKKAKAELQSEAPAVSRSIVNQLAGKDLV